MKKVLVVVLLGLLWCNTSFSKDVKILYGGSVKANNYKEILNLEEVDGLLVGSASINIDEFNKIIKF